MSDVLMAEWRHRYNQHVSERRRLGFPRIGHSDTWLIDYLQIIVERPPSSFPLLFFPFFPLLPPSFPPFFIIHLHYYEKKAKKGSLIILVEAIKIYNCLFYVGSQ